MLTSPWDLILTALFAITGVWCAIDLISHRAQSRTSDGSISQHTIVDINLKGTFLCCRGAIPLLRKSGGGAIVTTGSELAYVAEQNISVYSATKAAVVHFTRCLANDHGADGIRVNCVCPGPVQTPMLERGIKDSPDPALTRRRTEQTTILGRLGQPVEIANVVYFLASDEASFITGSAILADGGVTSKAT